MKKILYIVSTLYRSGPTNQLFNLIKYLDREQFEPYLITLTPEPNDSRWDDYAALGVKLYSLNLSRVKGVLLAKRKVKTFIDKIEPDLIHTQGIRADIISSKLNRTAVKVCTVHNHPQYDYVMNYGKILAKIMLYKHITAFKKLDKCIGVSATVEDNLNQLTDNIKTHSIPNGVDTEFFTPITKSQKQDLRKKLSLPENAVIWIASGHLSPLKDPLFLIENWQEAFPSGSENILIFIGNGSLFNKCRDLVENKPYISLQGRVSNVVEFLQAADYFVSASKSEGLPMAVIEALACGLPALLSDIGPHKEVVSMNDQVGEIFKLGDSNSFISAINSILSKDRDVMSKAAIDLIASKLSAQTMSKSYQGIYLSCASN